VNAWTTGDQDRASVAAGAGGFVVAWQSPDEDGSGPGVFARRSSVSGALGPVFRVNTFTTGIQGSPVVSGDASGFVVAWHSDEQDGSGLGIYAQRLDAGGNPLGSEFAVNASTGEGQAYPSVASGPGGGFVVVWQSYLEDGSSHGVFGQRFSFCTMPDQAAPLVTAPLPVAVPQSVCQ
jgi:hypothetical protein